MSVNSTDMLDYDEEASIFIKRSFIHCFNGEKKVVESERFFDEIYGDGGMVYDETSAKQA